MNPLDSHKIDRIEADVYSRKKSARPYVDERAGITYAEFDVESEWKNEEGGNLKELLERERSAKEIQQGNLFKKILIGSVIFFVGAVASASIVFLRGSNSISANNIDIQIVGPSSIGGGEELTYDIVIKNNNSVALETSNLSIAYPDGTRIAGDVATELSKIKEDVGLVPARGEVRKTMRAVLFGEKDSLKEIKMTYEYRIENSGALFYKDKNYDIVIKSTPLVVTIEHPEEVNSNSDVEFTVTIASNSGETLSDVLLKAEYPFGFTFQSADVKPIDASGTLWNVGELSTSQKQVIRIKGILQGQDEEARTFRFSVGIANPTKEDELGAIFSVLPQTVRIKRPFIGITANIGGQNSGDAVTDLGQRVQGTVFFSNNLQSPLLNAKVSVALSGPALDKSMVSAGSGGFYRSLDSTINWDKSGNSFLARIEPGGRGDINFGLAVLNTVTTGVSQSIDIAITVSGEQVDDNGKSQLISTTVNRSIKLASRVSVGARIVRSVGTFENGGPVPPRVDVTTTYTVIWTASNSLNTVGKATMIAQLPPYVTFTGFTGPGGESITYDSNTRQVVWNIGELGAGAGFRTSPRTAQFQVGLTPSANQVASSPTIVQNSNFSGVDEFTRLNVSAEAPALTTQFTTDPTFKSGDDVIAN
jgi:hypothetical protein